MNIVKIIPEGIYYYPKDQPIMDNDVKKSRSFKISTNKGGTRERWYKKSWNFFVFKSLKHFK